MVSRHHRHHAGAATHVLWDGFAHDGWWPARMLYPGAIILFGRATTAAAIVWKVSTLLGSFAVARYCIIRWRSEKRFALSTEAISCIVTSTLATLVVFTVVYRVLPRDPDVGHWHATVAAAQTGIAVVAMWCIASNWLSRHR